LSWLATTPKTSMDDILSMAFVEELHQRLFGDVWEWAGSYRHRELNIGVKQKPLVWSNTDLDKQSQERGEYIASLRQADAGDYAPLIQYLQVKGN
jgi:fido (protein-threonine AMPylation protein)